ncbi:MAG: DUF547 domain-containing protein [Sphingomonas sp.]
MQDRRIFVKLFNLMVAALIGLLVMAAGTATAAPKAELLARWQKSGAGAMVDYGAWNGFLKRYGSRKSDGRTIIAYGKLSTADKNAFYGMVNQLEAVNVDQLTKQQQLAYWINLYNAATVEVVLRAYPVSSILYIRDGLLPTGPWDRKVLTVKGQQLSLNNIEHGILRPIFKDPRVHFAINCASFGCPNLALEAYEPGTLNAQLDAGAHDYINDPRGFTLKGGNLVASRIFDWYGEDFGGPTGVLSFARRFATPQTARALANRATINSYDYNWSLNDAK